MAAMASTRLAMAMAKAAGFDLTRNGCNGFDSQWLQWLRLTMAAMASTRLAMAAMAASFDSTRNGCWLRLAMASSFDLQWYFLL